MKPGLDKLFSDESTKLPKRTWHDFYLSKMYKRYMPWPSKLELRVT